ncbi:MAG: 2-succinyl-5-enolpyruvyl-6-hydroxy-3-cyclohexene-1-carboxylic-acid synthase [Actinobacteria bacterium]|nr:2-succinyl-5-enolpyruvyl-6-hydroxy-3-cyclohexene-1-carboxylic-acid synthase [Actinomycetota bacterium]
MTEANLLTEWSRLLFASLADAGVTDVVLSPGSRSTPFMLAADAEPRLRCHDSVDERAAGFFALGLARVSGRPAVLLCTSGTAGAHYFPAVIEASLANVPMVVVTADRPFELQDCGAAQTIDQVKLFGDFVRRFYELGSPDAAPSALAGLRRLAAQAVHFASAAPAGPVHLNARARKPLEPRQADTDDERALAERVSRLLARPPVVAHQPVAHPSPDAVTAIARRCSQTERGLIVAGPAPLSHGRLLPLVEELSRRTGYPVLAEATSQLRFADGDDVLRCDGFDAALRAPAFRRSARPEVVVQIGGTPVSSGWERYVAEHDDVTRVVVARDAWPDPDSTATDVLLGDVELSLRALTDALAAHGAAARAGEWASLWREADRVVWAAVDAELAWGDELGEGEAVRTLAERLPRGSLLMVGNSLPIREVDTFCPSHAAEVGVLSQRGANGIDGLVAGAAGSALAGGDLPVTLVLGDVSLLHDLTGLAPAVGVDVPLVVVVVQNQGGRIFEQLPLASTPGLAASTMAHVTTPHGAVLEHAALLWGHRYAAATSAAELAKALDDAYAQPGCTVVEAVVPPHGAAAQHARLFAAVEQALAG